MPTQVAPSRPDLYSQVRAGQVLGVGRRTVADIARKLGLKFKSDPTRNGLLLSRDDLDRIAVALGSPIDWDAVLAA